MTAVPSRDAGSDATTTTDPWTVEAGRLHQRYVVEVVEACGLCPWAEPARRAGRTRTTVLLQQDDANLEPSLAVLRGWAADDRVEIGFLVLPRLHVGRVDFDRFVARMQATYAQLGPVGETPFAMAAFHPDASARVEDAERLIPFLRRTPDPCIQVIRMSTLRRVRNGTPQGTQFVDVTTLDFSRPVEKAPAPLRQRIAQANLETVQRLGLAEFAARIEDVHRDRDQTYARLTAG